MPELELKSAELNDSELVDEGHELLLVPQGDEADLYAAVAGFELVSCATPPRAYSRGAWEPVHHRFVGDSELGEDIRIALSPLLAEMPAGSALSAEYVFSPVGDGGVRVRHRLLVECTALGEARARAQAIALRDELALCLRVVADWYAFKPVLFGASDRARCGRRKLAMRAQPRVFAVQADGRIGFSAPSRRGRSKQVLMPQPAAGDTHLGGAKARALQLHASGAGTLMQCLRAARGLMSELSVTIALRRHDVAKEDQYTLRELAGKVSAGMHGDTDVASSPQVTGVAAAAALEAIEALLAQPECLALQIESDARSHGERAWLRLLWRELFPGFTSELIAIPTRSTGSRSAGQNPIDTSQLLAPALHPPALLPAPPVMETLGFARHYANPAVMFPSEGLHLGQAQIGGVVVDVRMPHTDRSRHTYVLGATGTGKSTLLLNMAIQDMRAGHGMAVIDPHGDLFDELLLAVPGHRRSDLMLVDVDDERFRPCLNPMDLEGATNAVAVNRVVNDMLEIFERLYDMKSAGGPVFEEYFRHAMLLAAAGSGGGPLPADGPTPTLASITHVLRNKAWRTACVARLAEVYGSAAPAIRQFVESAEATRGEHAFDNLQGYVTSKLSRFVTSATLHRLFCTGRRTIDFRKVMDERRILLINLSKGDLGSADARLVGMLLTKYLYKAAQSRADIPRDARVPFYFYLDEFQNFVASDIPEMLAEARKYGLFMTLANQTLGQLKGQGQRDALDAVLGNAATRFFFRVGQHEAETVESGFAPHFDRQTLLHLPDRHVLCRLLLANQPSLPFVFETMPAMDLPPGASAARSKEWAAGNTDAQ